MKIDDIKMMEYFMQGYTLESVGAAMHFSPRTISSRVQALMRKHKAISREHLTAKLLKLGILTLDSVVV